MKVVGVSEGKTVYLIKVHDHLYYHGDGDNGALVLSVGCFLRFNPYLEDSEDPNIEVPDKIKADIERLLKMLE